ncbi:DsbA family protein [Labrys neptuniae]
MSLKRLMAGLALGAALLISGQPALAAEQLDKPAIEAIVKNYLMEHPEVIVDAINAMQAKQEAAAADHQKKLLSDSMDSILNGPQNAVLGNPQGDVTLVEFFDYNCGYCKRGLADMVKLLDTDKKLKVVLRDYPILSDGSREAAVVALAVKKQLQGDKFLEFHQVLLGTRGAVGKDRALQVAQDSGVDMTKLQADMKDPALLQGLANTLRLGETLGINGTPSYVLGSEITPGAVGYDALKAKIDSLRKCGQTACG